MSDLTTTDLGQAGAAIEAEEARKVIEGLRGLLARVWESSCVVVAHEYGCAFTKKPFEGRGDCSCGLDRLCAAVDAALEGKP